MSETLGENLAPAHNDPHGVVWTVWAGSGNDRRLIQKELGFRSRRLFVKYVQMLTTSDNFDDFISGWSTDGELTVEDLDSLSVVGEDDLG